jgi:hypothetical protein
VLVLVHLLQKTRKNKKEKQKMGENLQATQMYGRLSARARIDPSLLSAGEGPNKGCIADYDLAEIGARAHVGQDAFIKTLDPRKATRTTQTTLQR